MLTFNPLKNQKIKTKFSIFLVVPLTVILFFSYQSIEQKYSRYKNIQVTEQFITISLQLAELIHQLQKERGLSAGYLGSHKALFSAELTQQRVITDQVKLEFSDKLTQFNQAEINDGLKKIVLPVMEQLQPLTKIRRSIDNGEEESFFAYYSKLNATILTQIQHIQVISDDHQLSRQSYAYSSLLWLKEYMGQERGALNGVFARKRITPNLFQDINGYVRSQENSLRDFKIIGSLEQQQFLLKQLAQPVNQEVINMRHIAIEQSIRLDLLNQIQLLVGYTGLIHDFKNHLIRDDVFYADRFRSAYQKMLKLLEKYDQLIGTSSKDKQSLVIIEKTFAQYSQYIETIAVMKKAGKTIAEIDRLVKVDDTPAATAFDQLRLDVSVNSVTKWWDKATARIESIKQVSEQIGRDLISNIEQAKQESMGVLRRDLLITLSTLILTLVLAVFLLQRLAGEIIKIADDLKVMRMTKKYDHLLNVTGHDEITDVEEAFNELISERNQTEANMRLSQVVFRSSTEAIMISDADNKIVLVNPAFNRITGYSEHEVIGKTPAILKSKRQNKAYYQSMWHQLLSKGHWEGEIWNRRKSGEEYLEWLIIDIIQHDNGSIQNFVAMFMDITKHKQYEESVWKHANYDSLTELPNRQMLTETLKQSIHDAKRLKFSVTVLFINLDRFNSVNNSFGHHEGDKLLQIVAQRLISCIRDSDKVARLGNDEFIILLPNIVETYEIEQVVSKILTSLAQAYALGDESVAHISASIGITIYPNDGSSAENLLNNANMAMHKAKEKGKNNFQFFTEAMNDKIALYSELESELRQAINEQKLCLFYQPIYDANKKKIVAAEALIRWPHETKGFIYPDQFIPLAEETGLIVPLGLWIIKEAWAFAEKINLTSAQPIRVAINISSRQCFDDGQAILALIQQIKSEYTGAGFVDMEITESMLMNPNQKTIGFMQKIRDLGMGIHLDDFGTGYSSLSYLKRFPVSKLKIDRSFIQNIIENEEDAKLAKSIIQLGHTLNLKTIAEGVETAEQFAMLKENQCELIQGYYFSKPLPADEFCALLNEQSDTAG